MNKLDKDCLFCKIIRGEVASYTVFENEDVKAYLDISQVNPGHTLLIPKKHITNFFDYSAEDAQQYLQYIPVVANAIKNFDPKITGMNVTTNNGESAGQVVMHSHIHFIPRFAGDGLNNQTRNNADNYEPADYQKIADAIKAQF
ncbi:HIT family protein [Lactobacillus sp. ESL0681]|uniref:HIT family protein n=1 Tax=Lactobacillus sp. ESL0681 TaxID=2983211 RepID=UPI0023F8D104|nr:HIT family protein [Lactobacillus sp. ESL0681]WEV40953.1 HIT family protein [Lactobacillus sp. ESL0681]